MTTVSKFTCKPCCGRYFTVPCCGLVGKCLELTIICPSTGTSVLGIPFTGQTRNLCSDVPVFYNPNYFGTVVDETAIFWDGAFINKQPEPCSYSIFNFSYRFKCTKTVCDVDYPWSPTPLPYYIEPCSEIHYNPDAINDPAYYTLMAGYEAVTPFMIIKKATSCNPFYWEYTWTYPTPNTNPNYWSSFADGTKFIITEGRCCNQGSSASGSAPGSTPGGATSGSVPAESGIPGSSSPGIYTRYWKVCDPFSNGGIPQCLQQDYFVGNPPTPPGFPFFVGPFTTSGECAGAYLEPCTQGWTPPPAPSSGSTPSSGGSTAPGSTPTSGGSTSPGSTAPGSTAPSGGSTPPGSTNPQQSGPWMILE